MSTSRASLAHAAAAHLEPRIGRRLPDAVARALRGDHDAPGALHAVARVIVEASTALAESADPQLDLDGLVAARRMGDGISPGVARSIVEAVRGVFGAPSAAA